MKIALLLATFFLTVKSTLGQFSGSDKSRSFAGLEPALWSNFTELFSTVTDIPLSEINAVEGLQALVDATAALNGTMSVVYDSIVQNGIALVTGFQVCSSDPSAGDCVIYSTADETFCTDGSQTCFLCVLDAKKSGTSTSSCFASLPTPSPSPMTPDPGDSGAFERHHWLAFMSAFSALLWAM